MFWLIVGGVTVVVLLVSWRMDRRRVPGRRAVDDPGVAHGQLLTEVQRSRDLWSNPPF